MQVYLDHNSTTPMDRRVLDAMTPFFSANYGNPSSAHSYGAIAARAMANARQQVAELVRADSRDVVFCSSATEAINTVIGSVRQGSLVTTEVEHAATLRAVERNQNAGGQTTYLKVDQHGQLDLAELARCLERQATSLVSVLWANNETGVIFPIREISELCSEHAVPLHVDAAQAVGKIRVDLEALPIDYLTISAHKINGPMGIAALIKKGTNKLEPLLIGGQQEQGMRAGTENVPGIVGFGVAAAIALSERESRQSAIRQLRDEFERDVIAHIAGTWVNGAGSSRLDNTSNIGFRGVDGDELSATLDAKGIAVSTGSACHSRATEPSHVIRAMTGSYEAARASVRFSLSHVTTEADMKYVSETLVLLVRTLRST